MCRPTDVYMGHDVAQDGGVAPDTCESKGAAPPDDPTAGESCRYFWGREVPAAGPSRYSNTVGFCWKHAIYQYDSNGDTVPDAPWPRCPDLTTDDIIPPVHMPPRSDALEFVCVQAP